jgi:hypothetical protein
VVGVYSTHNYPPYKTTTTYLKNVRNYVFKSYVFETEQNSQYSVKLKQMFRLEVVKVIYTSVHLASLADCCPTGNIDFIATNSFAHQ